MICVVLSLILFNASGVEDSKCVYTAFDGLFFRFEDEEILFEELFVRAQHHFAAWGGCGGCGSEAGSFGVALCFEVASAFPEFVCYEFAAAPLFSFISDIS